MSPLDRGDAANASSFFIAMAFKIESQPRSKGKMLIQFGYENTQLGWSQLAETAQFRVVLLARCCGLSLRQLQRRFKADFEETPKKWLHLQRMEAAQQLVSEGFRAKEIAAKLFFKDLSHFSKAYKAYANAPLRKNASRDKKRSRARK